MEGGCDRLVDSVEHSGDGGEEVGFEDLDVFNQAQGRTGGITDQTSSGGDVELECPL